MATISEVDTYYDSVETIYSVVILDWDDTLFPNHFLQSQYPQKHPFDLSQTEWFTEDWDKLEKKLYDTLQDLQRQHPIYIVTDAEDQWVQLTCKKFYPKLWNLFDDIEVHSANSLFKKQFPDSSFKRKSATIERISSIVQNFDPFFEDSSYQFLSVGDAPHDRQAIKSVAESKQWAYKNIKFQTNPSVKTLFCQWNLLNYMLPRIMWTHGDMDLSMNITYHSPSPPPELDLL